MQSKASTDIDRKLAIYYHPLFQEVIKNILLLFQIPLTSSFEIGLLEFIQFNLKLQKSLLPSFQIQNALISALNDWVKEVAECLSYEGMISTTKCEEITSDNFQMLLLKELESVNVEIFLPKDQYIRMMIKMGNHDAFKLLGVKINKQVFNKFMFDLCSTWCQFLDIELFSYFLIGIYIQVSEGDKLQNSKFRKTFDITAIDLQFMEEFQEIKALYSKTRKKQLRYYRAWCEWNYLRINEIGEALIVHLDQINDHDKRILELAHVFQKSIQVINEEITSQNQVKSNKESPKKQYNIKSENQQKDNGEFLILKKINVIKNEQNIDSQSKEKGDKFIDYEAKETTEPIQQIGEEMFSHDFQIQIDPEGNMYLKRIVKLPIIGTRIQPDSFHNKEIHKLRYLQKKKEECRHVSNLYRRMENMKIRLEHDRKNDHYSYKNNVKIAERDQFYRNEESIKNNLEKKNPYTNNPVEKIIHGKVQPANQDAVKEESSENLNIRESFGKNKEIKQPIRMNADYIHKVMAPTFLTDSKNNISYSKGEGYIYGVGAHSQKRDLKIGLPKLKHFETKLQNAKSYHYVGKIMQNRQIINQKLRSFSITQPPLSKLQKQKQEYKHVWKRYIDEEEMKQLTNYNQFYKRLQKAKREFGRDHQSEYRLNLNQILIYQNKRSQMGGVIDKKDQERFYERMEKLIRKQNRRNIKKKRKNKLKEYRKAFKNKNEKSLYQDIFINYHRGQICKIKEERRNASFAK